MELRDDPIVAAPVERTRRPAVHAACPVCGVLEDVPDGSDLRMELSGGSVRLHGTLPRARWAGAAIVASSLHADRNEVPWPAAEEGEPAPATDMPDAWPAGPLRVSVILLWDTSFAVLSQMARAPDTA